MLDRLSQRERIMIIVLVFISIIAFYYFFAYQPLIDKINNLTHQVQMEGQEFTNTLSIIKKLPEVKERYNELKGIEEKMIEREYCTPENILKSIETKANNNNIEIMTFIPDKRENIIRLNIILDGSFKNYCDFLDSISELKNKVEFDKLYLEMNKEKLLMNMLLTCNKTGDLSDE